jgi:hypothetical protein
VVWTQNEQISKLSLCHFFIFAVSSSRSPRPPPNNNAKIIMKFVNNALVITLCGSASVSAKLALPAATRYLQIFGGSDNETSILSGLADTVGGAVDSLMNTTAEAISGVSLDGIANTTQDFISDSLNGTLDGFLPEGGLGPVIPDGNETLTDTGSTVDSAITTGPTENGSPATEVLQTTGPTEAGEVGLAATATAVATTQSSNITEVVDTETGSTASGTETGSTSIGEEHDEEEGIDTEIDLVENEDNGSAGHMQLISACTSVVSIGLVLNALLL